VLGQGEGRGLRVERSIRSFTLHAEFCYAFGCPHDDAVELADAA
jgi:hypothetical protein